MTYEIEFKPRALNDLKALPESAQHRIIAKIEALRDDLAGDVKRLSNSRPEYRLRVGDYRVLFEVEGTESPCIALSTEKMTDEASEEMMLKLHPEILMKNAKKEFVVLPYEEFQAMQEHLAADLLALRKAKRSERKKKSVPLADVKRELGL